MSIHVKDLVKNYGEQKAVNHISFKIDKGEIAGFLGPNGAGKSTTMKILTGYLQQDGGHALVCGINAAVNPIDAKKKLGYLPEANPLYYDMYVREYLHFIADVHQLPDKKKRVEDAIALTGLSPESRKKTGQLSKGYKQRVGLAAALIHDPEVLVLDEPTSGLDPNQIGEIREVIRQLGKNKTVLFSSHILQEVEAICDRVIIINKGQIVADDALQNLQQTKGKRSIVAVEFDKPVEQTVLNELQDVLQTEQLHTASYKLHTVQPETVRRQLLELALRHNLNIMSLQNESRSLESIFKSLTA